MNMFVALVSDVPVLSRSGHPAMLRSHLPNGLPFVQINPRNFEFFVSTMRQKSVMIQEEISVVIIDLHEILTTDFVSPDSIPGFPEWISVN